MPDFDPWAILTYATADPRSFSDWRIEAEKLGIQLSDKVIVRLTEDIYRSSVFAIDLLLHLAVGRARGLIETQDVDEFSRIAEVPRSAISQAVLDGVAKLDEVEELEPFLRDILFDRTETPHGPTEIADILTSHIHVRGKKSLGGFVLKGRGFPRVTSKLATHQFAKLRTIANLDVMVLVAVGAIQDDAQRDFVQAARDAGCAYLILNAHECARLLIAYEKICASDGTPIDECGMCRQGHRAQKATIHNA